MNRISSDGSTSTLSPPGGAPFCARKDDDRLPNDEHCTTARHDYHDNNKEIPATSGLDNDDENESMAINMADPLTELESFLQQHESGVKNHGGNSKTRAVSPQIRVLLDRIDKDLMWFISLTGLFSLWGLLAGNESPAHSLHEWAVGLPLCFGITPFGRASDAWCAYCLSTTPRIRALSNVRTTGSFLVFGTLPASRLLSGTLTRDILHDMEQMFRIFWLACCHCDGGGGGNRQEGEIDAVDSALAIVIGTQHDDGSGDESPHPIVARV